MEYHIKGEMPLRLHVLAAMSDDLEDWDHVVGSVEETTGRRADLDAIQRELESLIQEGLVNAFAVSPEPDGCLKWVRLDRPRIREEWTYWFHPTESGVRLYCDAVNAPYPTEQLAVGKLNPPDKPIP